MVADLHRNLIRGAYLFIPPRRLRPMANYGWSMRATPCLLSLNKPAAGHKRPVAYFGSGSKRTTPALPVFYRVGRNGFAGGKNDGGGE